DQDDCDGNEAGAEPRTQGHVGSVGRSGAEMYCKESTARLTPLAGSNFFLLMTEPTPRIAELKDHVGQRVTVRGWVTHVRSSGKVAFAVIRDGTGIMQAVFVKTALPAEIWDRFKELTLETSVRVTGEVRAEPRAPGGYELGVSDLTIVGASPIDYPIQPKEHGIDFLLDHRHFWLRSNRQRAI